MDMGQIAAAATNLKIAGEIVQGLISLKTMAEVQAKAIELNGKIIAAQHDLFAVNASQTVLVERVRDLEGQIADMKAWEAEKQRYKLVSPFSGAMVYAVQKHMSNGEPPHYLCTSCYKAGKPSILQIAQNKEGWSYFGCPICKSEARTGYRGAARPKYAEDVATD